MPHAQAAQATGGVASWFASLSPILAAALFTGTVALIALLVQTTVNVLNNRSQRALDRERFENEKATDERRWRHERQTEELAEVRAYQSVALPLREIVLAIVECCRPVYVRGNIAYEAWDRFNKKLHDRLERDDAAERLGFTGYGPLRDFYDQSVFTHAFIVDKVTDAKKLAELVEPGENVFPLLITYLKDVFFGAADALDALDDHESAKAIRDKYDEFTARLG